MSAAELLAGLRDRGILLRREGEELVCHDPRGAIKPAVAATIRQAKPALLALLAAEAESDAMVAAAYRRIGETLPAGAVTWADAERPALTRAVDDAANAWEQAYLGEDLAGLAPALAAFEAAIAAVTSAFAGPTQEAAQPPLWER